MHRFRRASAAGAPKEGNAQAAENSQRSSATAASAPTAPYSTTNNTETTDEPAVNGSGKRAAASPPSTTGFFSNRHHSAPPPRISDGENISPFAALKNISGSNADNAPDRQPPPPASSSSLWRGNAPSSTASRTRGAPSVAAGAEQPAPPLPSPPCFRFPSSSASGKRQQAPLPTPSFATEHDRPNTDNMTNSGSDHGNRHGDPSPPDTIRTPPPPKSAATHQPRGTAAPRTGGVNVRGDGQQGRARGSIVGEGALKRCAPRDSADLGRRNDGGGDSAGNANGPPLRDERQAPAMPTAPGGRTGARCSTPPPNDRGAGSAVAAVAALPPSQLDTVMEDHDPFDDLSVAEGAIFADASARIQKLRRRQLSVREGFARSHSRLLQGDAGFKIHADAEQLVASTFSLLEEMNLEADAPRDEARSQQTQDQQQHDQGFSTA